MDRPFASCHTVGSLDMKVTGDDFEKPLGSFVMRLNYHTKG